MLQVLNQIQISSLISVVHTDPGLIWNCWKGTCCTFWFQSGFFGAPCRSRSRSGYCWWKCNAFSKRGRPCWDVGLIHLPLSCVTLVERSALPHSVQLSTICSSSSMKRYVHQVVVWRGMYNVYQLYAIVGREKTIWSSRQEKQGNRLFSIHLSSPVY